MSLVTKLIEGTKPEAQTLLEIQQKMGIQTDVPLNLMVFETTFKDKKVYTCWSGGEMKNGEVLLTLIGRAAMEALINLPLGCNDTLIYQELKVGPTRLKEKVQAAVMKAQAGAKICFFGDMQGELDGLMPKAFNLSPGTIKVSH